MSDLKPRGVPVMVDGVERHFLFTLNVIDEIQDHYNLALSEVIDKLTDKGESLKVLRYLIATLLNDEAARCDQNLEMYSEEQIGWIIDAETLDMFTLALLRAYGISLPEADEYGGSVPNEMGGQQKE